VNTPTREAAKQKFIELGWWPNETMYRCWTQAIEYVTELKDKEIADLRKQLAAEQALRNVKDGALADIARGQSNRWANFEADAVMVAKNAVNQTSPTVALDAAIADAVEDFCADIVENLRDANCPSGANMVENLIEQRKEKVK
jgi:ABC-type arginine transport system ATPase subunit